MPTGQLQFWPAGQGQAFLAGIGNDFYAIVMIPSSSASAPAYSTYIAIFLTTFAQVTGSAAFSGPNGFAAAVSACQAHYNALAS